MRILIIEDEEKIARGLKRGLEKEGFAVDYVTDGRAGERRILLHQDDYDLIILDLMLPHKNGEDICRSIREEGVTTPVLVLTAKDDLENKISTLDYGADDYLVKPFSFEELVARVRAILRRPEQSLPSVLKAGDLVLNPATKKVKLKDRELDLTLKEFMLLEYMMRNQNIVLSREQIHSHVWDFADDSFSNTIDVHVKNLRKKLAPHTGDNRILETVRGVGYRLKG